CLLLSPLAVVRSILTCPRGGPTTGVAIHIPRTSGWGTSLGVIQPDSVVNRVPELLLAAEITLGGLDRSMTQEIEICSSSPPARWHRQAHVRRRSCGARLAIPAFTAAALTTCH